MNDLFSSSSFKKYADASPAPSAGDMETGGESVVNLDKFFEEVEAVKEDMKRLEGMFKRLQSTNEETKTAHDARTVKSLRARMDKDVEQVLRRAKAVKGKLEELDRSNATSRKVPGCGPGSSTDRTRTSVVAGLGKKLKDLMDDFQVRIDDALFNHDHPSASCRIQDFTWTRHAGAEGEDGGGVQGDGGAAVLHGDGGEAGGQHDRGAHLVGGERVLPAEGHPGARARAGDGHHLGDPGAARRRQGHRAQPHGPAPGVPRHGRASRGAGPPAQRRREPRRARQLLRAQGNRRAGDRARVPEEQPQVDVHRRPRRHPAHRRPHPARPSQPAHLDAPHQTMIRLIDLRTMSEILLFFFFFLSRSLHVTS
ncbi:hypothetical protein C2845_PM09G17390 [Panicum miliaceum]|uniref:Syntaxin N-terminal domain-containing protein n=1 Tax=Panicum miliaceum TaxID=4540 RepID=A0A3L6S0E7_PANMI|nr:hypothetical protein C2845_PM09G17390 [Panicum miliaceum]